MTKRKNPTSGIYKIKNLLNGKCYIGSSVAIHQRWAIHNRLLKRQKHHSILLQRAWDKCGEENFIYEILEKVEQTKLLEREQYYLDSLKPEYNILAIAGSCLGVKRSDKTKQRMSRTRKKDYDERGKTFEHIQSLADIKRGTTLPEEQKEKISVSLRGEKNHNWKRPKRPEELQKMKHSALKRFEGEKLENHPNAKLNWEIVKDIREQYSHGVTMKELAEKHNIKKPAIWKVVHNYSWVEKTEV